MFIMETLAGFDVLALGVIFGSAALIAGLVWILVDNRQFEGFKPAANRFGIRTGRPAANDTHPVTEHQSAEGPQSPRAA